jgi:hypothetical protein
MSFRVINVDTSKYGLKVLNLYANFRGRTLSNLEQHRISKHHEKTSKVSDENVNSMPTQPSLDVASINLVALKSLFPENLFDMLSTVNAQP